MTYPAAFASNRSIDLHASDARLTAARRLAAEQAERVACCKGGASDASIDLLFLLQESVLVFDETHAMLAALAAAEAALPAAEAAPGRAEKLAHTQRDDGRRPRSKPFVTAARLVAFLAVLAAATMLIEIVDPAPLEVQAVGLGSAPPNR